VPGAVRCGAVQGAVREDRTREPTTPVQTRASERRQDRPERERKRLEEVRVEKSPGPIIEDPVCAHVVLRTRRDPEVGGPAALHRLRRPLGVPRPDGCMLVPHAGEQSSGNGLGVGRQSDS
jgi:hypothetical protein